ncbi:reverse transcriptase domain-containing protein [Tanacetum coccineum]
MFGAEEGMFLGHTISKDIIQACGEKAQGIINMPSPRTLKDMQSQNEKLASLNRFLSKAAEKSLLFFKILKWSIKKSNFAWTEEAEKALKEMKKHMMYLPTLTALIKGETLIIYLSVAEEAISTVLLVERDDKQIVVYFVGWAVQPPEVNCSLIEKLVISPCPRDKEAKEILPNFLAKVPSEKASLAEEPMEELTKGAANIWKLFTGGSSNDGGSGIGLILTSPEGIELNCVLRFEFNALDNEAEYEA